MCELVEEIILGEGEQLAEQIFEVDYRSLNARQRYLLRLAAIAQLGFADMWLGTTVMKEKLIAGDLRATAADSNTRVEVLQGRS